jgi:hypothetical protein
MRTVSRTTLDPTLYPEGPDVEAGGSAVSWSAIWAGTATAIALSLLLLAIGSGFGFMAVSPWPGVGAKATSFSIGAGIWLIVMQWLSSAVGGYMAGRLRTRWHSLHTHEVFFRDTAHGLITWAVATIIVAGVAVLMSTLTGLAAAGPVDVNMTREAAEEARKAAISISLFTGISMLIGAFISCVGAAIGGDLRDKHP